MQSTNTVSGTTDSLLLPIYLGRGIIVVGAVRSEPEGQGGNGAPGRNKRVLPVGENETQTSIQ